MNLHACSFSLNSFPSVKYNHCFNRWHTSCFMPTTWKYYIVWSLIYCTRPQYFIQICKETQLKYWAVHSQYLNLSHCCSFLRLNISSMCFLFYQEFYAIIPSLCVCVCNRCTMMNVDMNELRVIIIVKCRAHEFPYKPTVYC